MKQEFPIAVVLLAAGGLIWFWQISDRFRMPGSNDAVELTANQEAALARQLVRKVDRFSNQNGVETASYQEVNNPLPDQTKTYSMALPANSIAQPVGELNSQFDFNQSQKGSPQTAEYLINLGVALRNSPPFKSDLQIQVTWFGQNLSLTGEYAQMGQGTGQSKIQLHIPTSSGQLSLIKVCDGRFLYTQLKTPENQSLEFVDLHKVDETRKASGLTEPKNPMGWVGSGGLSSLLENLGSAFDFRPLENVQANGHTYAMIQGSWNEKCLVELLRDVVDISDLEPSIKWEHLPGHMPHAVQMEFTNDQTFGTFPHRIEFLYFKSGNDGKLVSQPFATIEFSSPQSISVDSNEFLKLESDDIDTINATDQFVDQIRDFEYARQALLESESLIR